MESLLTIQEIAKYLRLDSQTVSRKAQRGELPGVKIGNRWRFRKEAIDRWLEEGKGDKGILKDPFQKLIHYLQTIPEVRLAYLFGSRARGDDARGSDTDIAVLFRPGLPLFRDDQIFSEASRLVEGETDLISLNKASPLLKYEVIGEGRLLHAKLSAEEVARFELGVCREFFDTAHLRKVQNELLVDSILGEA